MRSAHNVVCAAMLAACAAGVHAGSACDQWSPLSSGANASVLALALWDPDGDGPLARQLIAGGNFTSIGGVTANRLARWDGSQWHALDPGLESGSILALTTWDPDGDGPLTEQLIVGGNFVTAGGITVNDIARFDGTAFHALGGGVTPLVITTEVQALTTWDPDADGPAAPQLVIGGQFLGGVDAVPGTDCIARWDGSQWHALGSGFASTVRALGSIDPDGAGPLLPRLVAAGHFSGYLRQWDGSGWSPVGMDPDFLVETLTVHDPDGPGPAAPSIYIGGLFEAVGATAAHHVARWDGAAWSALGAGLEGRPIQLRFWDPDGAGPEPERLVAGMFFANNAQLPAEPRIAVWDGAQWQPFGDGLQGTVNALETWDPDGRSPAGVSLYAGGVFTASGAIVVNRIAEWAPCAPPPACPGDANGDNAVNGADLSVLLGSFNQQTQPGTGADFNGDGVVNGADLSVLLSNFSTTCV